MDTMERPNPRHRGAWIPARTAIPSESPVSRRRSLSDSNRGVPKTNVTESKTRQSRPQEQTFEEVKYLKRLIEGKILICVKLVDGEEIQGTVEYYDQRFIRVTRQDAPNLFVFKHDIKYLYEVA
jgi:sRNA-binding regulator protein Hfq